MGIGPVDSIRNKSWGQVFKYYRFPANLTLQDMDLVEINELLCPAGTYQDKEGRSTAQFLACAEVGKYASGLDMDKCNLNGGAISLGHPLGDMDVEHVF